MTPESNTHGESRDATLSTTGAGATAVTAAAGEGTETTNILVNTTSHNFFM